MDEIEKEIISENPEEPIFILNFKCSSNDYRYSEEMWSDLYGKSIIRRIVIHSIIIIILSTLLALVFSPYGINFKYSSLNNIFAFIITIAVVKVIKNIYFIICCKRKSSLWMHFGTRIRIRSFALVYENRTIKEIKIIIIPCKYTFYDTYFIKTIPDPEIMYITSAEKIVDLQLTIDIPIDYDLITNIYENKRCFTFGKNVFFPKNQLREDGKEQLDLIINKICSQNNIIR